MKHKLTPVPGARICVHAFAAIRQGVCHSAALRRLALSVALLVAAAPAFAQVIVSIETVDGSAAETPPDPGQFMVRRVDGDPLRPVRVRLATSGSATEGSDYSPLPDEIILNFAQQSALIDVVVPGDDNVFEGEESVTATLATDDSGVLIGSGSASLTIGDSPHHVTVSAAPTAVEGSTSGEFVIALGARNESGSSLTVTYSIAGSAQSGTDYQPPGGSAAIAPGASTATVAVPLLDDPQFETDETVEITLTGTGDPRVTVGSPASAALTIADDDVTRDDDGDGLANGDECPDFAACRDTDQDASPDFQDADDDADGVPTASEGPPGQDTDGNGTPDYLDGDDDGDGRPTRDEDANADGDGNPATHPVDFDGDQVPDYLDADDGGGPAGDFDGDGLTNEREEELGTDPQLPDSDGDGVKDGDEDAAGTDPLDKRSFEDTDGDLVPDTVEAASGSNPGDPQDFVDADGGGTADHVETVTYGAFGLPPTNPAEATDDGRDFDGDGLPDRFELTLSSAPDSSDSPTGNGAGDDDGNGITNAVEAYLDGLGIAAVDAASDFDRDGYPDAAEVRLGLDPLSPAAGDADGDGVPNVVEALAGVDANAATDTDADGVPDAREIALGSNTLDANSPVANGAADDDGDGVSNAIEHVLGSLGATEEITADGDLDGDGLGDAAEIRLGADPFHDEQPVPWIELAQADFGPVRALAVAGGQATARALTGGHQAGLSFDWSGSSAAVLAVSSGPQDARTLSFAPATLPPGLYELVVQVARTVGDVTTPVSVTRFSLDVLADASAATLQDTDGDGVPDGADTEDGRKGLANRLPAESIAPIAAEAGIRLRLGSTARSAQANSALVTPEDIAAATGGAGSAEDEFEYLGGIYDFEVTNLPQAGAVVRVVIPQASPIGGSPQYRKFVPGTGWTDFTEDDNDVIASAPDNGNACPPPGDDAYQPGLTPGHLCIELSIEDGGPNDGDAADGPNGVVKDPGGVGTPKGEVVVGQGSGAAGPFALIVLGLAAAWSRRRRRAGRGSAGRSGLALAGAVCLLAAAPLARADVFVGGGAGMSRLSPDTANTPFTVSDNGDYGFKVFGGVDLTPLSPNLSVEAFWADLGQTSLGRRGTLDYTVYGAGLLYGIGSVRVPRVSAYFELGYTQLEIDGDILFQQEESSSLFAGIAGSFAIGRHLFLQLEYEYFAEDAQFISLSLVRRFRTFEDDDDEVRTIPLPDRPPPE